VSSVNLNITLLVFVYQNRCCRSSYCTWALLFWLECK